MEVPASTLSLRAGSWRQGPPCCLPHARRRALWLRIPRCLRPQSILSTAGAPAGQTPATTNRPPRQQVAAPSTDSASCTMPASGIMLASYSTSCRKRRPRSRIRRLHRLPIRRSSQLPPGATAGGRRGASNSPGNAAQPTPLPAAAHTVRRDGAPQHADIVRAGQRRAGRAGHCRRVAVRHPAPSAAPRPPIRSRGRQGPDRHRATLAQSRVDGRHARFEHRAGRARARTRG